MKFWHTVPELTVCLWRRPEEAVPFIRKHFNVDCTINLPDSISNSSLTLCQQQSWVTSGPRLLQHLLFLLIALDEPSAANATLFGLVLLLLFLQSGGKKSISNPTLLSTGQQMAQVLCSQLMQMLEKIKENYYPARTSTKPVPKCSQGKVVSTLGCAELQSPPCPTEVISATQKSQSHFHCHPLVFTLWEKDMGGWDPPRILASVRHFPSLENRLHFNYREMTIFGAQPPAQRFSSSVCKHC